MKKYKHTFILTFNKSTTAEDIQLVKGVAKETETICRKIVPLKLDVQTASKYSGILVFCI